MRIPLSGYFLLEFLEYSLNNRSGSSGNYVFCKPSYVNIYDNMLENSRLDDIIKRLFE